MKINKIYLSRFKRYKYCYMYMIKRGVFLIFDDVTLEYKGLYTLYPYVENEEMNKIVNRLIALDYLEVI